MSEPASMRNDHITVIGILIAMPPPLTAPVPIALALSFSTSTDRQLSTDVQIKGGPATTIESITGNNQLHVHTSLGGQP